MKKLVLVMLSMILVSAFFAGSAAPATAKELKILEFETMLGVPPTMTGTKAAPAFRNINAGGLAWTLTSAKGELTASGHLEIDVVGLVFAEGSNTGSNTVVSFRGMVSCVNSDGTFAAPVLTGPFPATTGPAAAGGGNAKIEADLDLPDPCFAPIVFVTSPGGSWFAATGK